MDKTLRLLIVEDSEDDALLLVRELRRSGYELVHERVDGAEAVSKALASATWDLVIADYTMPQFRGTDALKIVKQQGFDIPFIFVSGTISEETAVEAMKSGAHDYVFKGNLKRLVPAIERELREAEVRRERKLAEEHARINLERVRALHEINLAITSTLDLRTIVYVLLEHVDSFLPCPTVTTLRLVGSESKQMEYLASRGVEISEWRMHKERFSLDYEKEALENKRPLMIADLRADPRTKPSAFYRQHGLVSYLGIPLVVKEDALGVLGFYAKERHEFTREEFDLLATLSAQAAMPIHNALMYERMRNLAGELSVASNVKSRFLAIMSHEFRTPLSVIVGYAGLFGDNKLGMIDSVQSDAIRKIAGQATNLLSMIDNILNASMLESGGVPVAMKEVDLGEFLAELKETYDLPLAKEISLNWQLASDLPSLITDPEKLQRIVQNLIQDAIKFTDRGSVTVSARYVPREASVEFKVEDTGIGIAEEHLPLIFEIFHQVDSSETRVYGGAGMGLYVAKKFTDLIGGKIDVASELGRGSAFTVKLPTRRSAMKD